MSPTERIAAINARQRARRVGTVHPVEPAAKGSKLLRRIQAKWRALELAHGGDTVAAYVAEFGEPPGEFLRRLRAAAVEARARHRWKGQP